MWRGAITKVTRREMGNEASAWGALGAPLALAATLLKSLRGLAALAAMEVCRGRKKARFALALQSFLLVLTLAGTAAAADLAVELPDVIEARDGTFYLGEYAIFEGDPDLADSASMVALSPRKGAITRDDVIDALGSSPVAGRQVILRMSERTTVKPESPIVSDLRKMTGWKWRIDVKGLDDPAGRFTLPANVRPGARAVSVKLIDDQGRKSNKGLKVSWYQPVVYSPLHLLRDVPLVPADLRTRIDLASVSESYLWEPKQLHNATARRLITAGSPISEDDLEQAVIVKRGSGVRLIAKVSGLGIEVQGIAMQHGGVGDVIRVKNLSSKKIVSAKVVAAGRVEIQTSVTGN